MKDAIGQELNVNDVVLFAMANYTELIKGLVISFTPKGINVLVVKPDWGKRGDAKKVEKLNRTPGATIKVDREVPAVKEFILQVLKIQLDKDIA